MNHQEKIAELRGRGFCVLRNHFSQPLLHSCREAFWPTLTAYIELNRDRPNRGPGRHFLAMPFATHCYAPEFFFDEDVLAIVRGVMDDGVVADQWGCDVPAKGSVNQQFHADYRRPLFAEAPDLTLPPYILTLSFGLVPITVANGAMEIAAGTHNRTADEALAAIAAGTIEVESIPLQMGDVLIRNPLAMHRGTPNTTETPRPLVTIRYVRRWYTDDSREVCSIPGDVWRSLSPEQKSVMRFPLTNGNRE